MNYTAQGTRGDLSAITTVTGVVVPHVQSAGGCTLGINTYFFPLGGVSAPTPTETSMISVQLKWAAAVAGTITLEFSNFPATLAGNMGTGGADILDYSLTAGDWQLFNPSATAEVYVLTSGGGNSATALTVTAGGSNAGGCYYNVPSFAARRARIKAVITTGGVVRASAHGKVGE